MLNATKHIANLAHLSLAAFLLSASPVQIKKPLKSSIAVNLLLALEPVKETYAGYTIYFGEYAINVLFSSYSQFGLN